MQSQSTVCIAIPLNLMSKIWKWKHGVQRQQIDSVKGHKDIQLVIDFNPRDITVSQALFLSFSRWGSGVLEI